MSATVKAGFEVAHLVKTQDAALLHDLTKVSSRLWPSAPSLKVSSVSASVTVPAAVHIEPSHPDVSSEIKNALTAALTPTPSGFNDPFSTLQRGMGRALDSAASYVAQATYNGLNGLFKLNRKIDLLGPYAPQGLQDLAQVNRQQDAAYAPRLYSALNLASGFSLNAHVLMAGEHAPKALRELAANDVQSYKDLFESFKNADQETVGYALGTAFLSAGLGSLFLGRIEAVKNAASTSLSGASVAAKNRRPDIFIPNNTKVEVNVLPKKTEPVYIEYNQRLSDLLSVKGTWDRYDVVRPVPSPSLARRSKSEALLISYPATGTHRWTQFGAVLEHGTLTFSASIKQPLPATGALTHVANGRRVVHSRPEKDALNLSINDHSDVRHAFSGTPQQTQAQLVNASLIRLAEEKVAVKRINVDLNDLELSPTQLLAIKKGPQNDLKTNQHLEDAVFKSQVGQAALQNGFNKARFSLDVEGKVAGVAFSKS